MSTNSITHYTPTQIQPLYSKKMMKKREKSMKNYSPQRPFEIIIRDDIEM